MKHHPDTWRAGRGRRGFSMVELLSVIGVIVVLAGIILGGASYAQRRAAISRAQSDLEQIKFVLEEYRVRFGRYPTTANMGVNVEGPLADTVMKDLLTVPTPNFPGAKPGLALYDPWGRSYVYRNAARYAYEILSFGPRGQTFDGDNISNRVGGP